VKRYFDEIENGVKQGSISAVNLSEFYYKTCQKLGKSTPDIRYYQVRNTRLAVVETDAELARNAGLEKCRQQVTSPWLIVTPWPPPSGSKPPF
jgi:hypothetical protein